MASPKVQRTFLVKSTSASKLTDRFKICSKLILLKLHLKIAFILSTFFESIYRLPENYCLDSFFRVTRQFYCVLFEFYSKVPIATFALKPDSDSKGKAPSISFGVCSITYPKHKRAAFTKKFSDFKSCRCFPIDGGMFWPKNLYLLK